jgi:3D (Asp-Asp-Asp) domain-containing protein
MVARRSLAAVLITAALAPSGLSAAPRTIRRNRPFVATAYCRNGETGTGTRARPGIVAADPRVLPSGSTVRVHDAARGNRTYTVEDRGVRGRHIDIFMSSCRQAKKFGRHHVLVRVLHAGSGRRLGR